MTFRQWLSGFLADASEVTQWALTLVLLLLSIAQPHSRELLIASSLGLFSWLAADAARLLADMESDR